MWQELMKNPFAQGLFIGLISGFITGFITNIIILRFTPAWEPFKERFSEFIKQHFRRFKREEKRFTIGTVELLSKLSQADNDERYENESTKDGGGAILTD